MASARKGRYANGRDLSSTRCGRVTGKDGEQQRVWTYGHTDVASVEAGWSPRLAEEVCSPVPA